MRNLAIVTTTNGLFTLYDVDSEYLYNRRFLRYEDALAFYSRITGLKFEISDVSEIAADVELAA